MGSIGHDRVAKRELGTHFKQFLNKLRSEGVRKTNPVFIWEA
jgi:hypothetical protein